MVRQPAAALYRAATCKSRILSAKAYEKHLRFWEIVLSSTGIRHVDGMAGLSGCAAALWVGLGKGDSL